jgi:putative FmdB family regulatory protein
MPIYEYQCLDCRQTFEVRRSFSDSDKPVPCSKCESGQTQKVLSHFYAQSSGHATTQHACGGGGGCGGCGGGSCGSCHH